MMWGMHSLVKASPGRELDLLSPCNTSDGWLRKKWKIIDGKRCLLKSGSNPFQQEPLNEVLATSLHQRLNHTGLCGVRPRLGK